MPFVLTTKDTKNIFYAPRRINLEDMSDDALMQNGSVAC